jgi:hypothetical protein
MNYFLLRIATTDKAAYLLCLDHFDDELPVTGDARLLNARPEWGAGGSSAGSHRVQLKTHDHVAGSHRAGAKAQRTTDVETGTESLHYDSPMTQAAVNRASTRAGHPRSKLIATQPEIVTLNVGRGRNLK